MHVYHLQFLRINYNFSFPLSAVSNQYGTIRWKDQEQIAEISEKYFVEHHALLDYLLDALYGIEKNEIPMSP